MRGVRIDDDEAELRQHEMGAVRQRMSFRRLLRFEVGGGHSGGTQLCADLLMPSLAKTHDVAAGKARARAGFRSLRNANDLLFHAQLHSGGPLPRRRPHRWKTRAAKDWDLFADRRRRSNWCPES